jgi:hypothetical protein
MRLPVSSATFTNRYTGETLTGYSAQVCPDCHCNFASTRAGDAHRVWFQGRRICISPQESGLEISINNHGAILWRTPRYKTPLVLTDRGFREEKNLSRS